MAVIDGVLADRVAAEARPVQLHPGRALLSFLAGALYLVGWLPSKALHLAGRAVGWSAAAVRLGWRDARTRPVDDGGDG